MQYYVTTWLTVILAIYTRSIISIPISGLAATADGWGLSPGLDSTVTVTSAINSTSGSNASRRYPKYMKGVDTGLTATALLLIAGTYYLVIKHATPLGNYCKLPSKVVSANVQALLGEAWPLAANGEHIDDTVKRFIRWNFTCIPSPKAKRQQTGQLLYIGWNDIEKEDASLKTDINGENIATAGLRDWSGYSRRGDLRLGQAFVAKCVNDCDLHTQTQEVPSNRLLWLRNKSVTVKNLVLLAIWEWMSLWLVLIMVVGTTIYNGFAAGAENPDRYPRLVLILVYALAFILHFRYTWVCFCRMYTNLVLNGCWTLLSNANFAVQKAKEVSTGVITKSPEYSFNAVTYESFIFGSTRLVPKYHFEHCKKEYGEFKFNGVLLVAEIKDGEDRAPKSLVELQDIETKTTEKATEVAMERIIFNATVLFSISVVTGFSTWTTSQLTDATSTQLGSLALLASTASGIAAMLSSAQNLKAMVSASWRYLEMTELIISGKKDPGADKPTMGFTKEGEEHSYHRVTLLDFWRAMGTWEVLGVLIFGPAFILLPFGKEQQGSPLERPFQMPVTLGKSQVFFSRTENEQVTVTRGE
jgi:hypothetical protein